MRQSYANLYNTRVTPQGEPVPGKGQVANSAGGYVFALDKWKRLDRFLILGSDAPTYYATAKALTRESAAVVNECLAEDAARTVDTIVAVSEGGRAARNDAALFALALAVSFEDSAAARQMAAATLPRVARTGTHLFQFVENAEALRGWGRVLRRGVANWYLEKPVAGLTYQVVKYRQRGGWSHRDLLRLAKPVPNGPVQDTLFRWVTKGAQDDMADGDGLGLLWAYEAAKTADGPTLLRLIADYRLTWEMLPTEALARADVWCALLGDMPMTAMLRNLGRMTANGLLAPGSKAARVVVERLGDVERLRRARIHPLSVLVALRTYQQGNGEKGKLTWQPVTQIVSALNKAFYDAFGNVAPTGKRVMLALDVSGSMGASISGLNATCREASAAMAMVTMKADPGALVYGFTSGQSASPSAFWGRNAHAGFAPLDISPDRRLDDIVRYTARLDFGGTDCALPMLYAAEKGMQIDAFVIFTDSETWAGLIHPFQALRRYRERTGIAARLVVVGMTSTGFSIADPNDAGSLNVVGFDTAAPGVISDFVAAEAPLTLPAAPC